MCDSRVGILTRGSSGGLSEVSHFDKSFFFLLGLGGEFVFYFFPGVFGCLDDVCWVVGCVLFVKVGGGLRLSYEIELDFIPDCWSNHFFQGVFFILIRLI